MLLLSFLHYWLLLAKVAKAKCLPLSMRKKSDKIKSYPAGLLLVAIWQRRTRQYAGKIALRIEVAEVPAIWAFCFITPEKPGLSTGKCGKLLCAECACYLVAH